MNGRRKLTAFAMCFALAAPMVATVAETRHRAHHRNYAYRTYYRPSVVVTDRGWRKRDTLRGWDSSCLDLPYLASRFACDAR